MGRRAGLSTVLIMGAIVLIISIAVGNSMGNRVLGQITARSPEILPSPSFSASPGGDQGAIQVLAQRHSVLSVATDPAFPDPRITPEPPPPPPTSRPVQMPKSTPRPSPSPTDDGDLIDSHYTSPPLPIPIVSHDPNEQSDPNGEPLPAASPSSSPEISPKPSTKP